MKHIYNLFISLCIALIVWSCEDSEKAIAPASLTISQNELTFSGYRSTLAVKVDATRRWSAVASEYWISVSPDSYPGANESFIANAAVTVSDNATGQPREGQVTFFLEDVEIATLTIKQNIQDEGERPEEEFPITWANLQWAASNLIKPGDAFEAGSCVFADGITNAVDSETGEDITCDIGYSLTDTDPSGEGWTWTSCPFNGDWGNNFYYQGRIENLPVGTYFYTFRFRNASGPYKYAGTNGLWDGDTNVNGTFEVKEEEEEEQEQEEYASIEDYGALRISWAILGDWAANFTIGKEDQFESGAQVFIEGLTDLVTETANRHVTCEIGYSTTNSDPSSSDWTWQSCGWNSQWGNNHYYQGKTPTISTPGTYYYTFRFRIDEGDYAYAGTDGLWNGANSTFKTFQVTE